MKIIIFHKIVNFKKNAYQRKHAIYPSYPSETTINNWAKIDLDIIGGNDLIFLSSIIDRKSRDSHHFSKKCKFHINAYQLNHAIYPSYPSETTINNWANIDLDIIGGNDFNFFEFHNWHKILWQSSFFKIV